MRCFVHASAALLLSTLPALLAAAQSDPPPDVADTVDTALQDTEVPAQWGSDSRIDPETLKQLESIFGTETIIVVEDPQRYVEGLEASGLDVEVVRPGTGQIQPYEPNAGGGSDWLAQQVAAADYFDQHQREQERKRAALRMATGLVIVVGILVLMLRKPWESKELPRPAPVPPAPDEVPPPSVDAAHDADPAGDDDRDDPPDGPG